MQLKFIWCHCVQKLHYIKCLFVWGKEYFIENCMHVPYLNKCRNIRHLKKYLRFIKEIQEANRLASYISLVIYWKCKIALLLVVLVVQREIQILASTSKWLVAAKYKISHRKCSIKKLFLKITQYLQVNICVGVCF